MRDQVKRNIGLRVKAARQQRGLTQAQLADEIDKAFETISNIERGKTAPNFLTLADIADVLQLNLKDFFDGDEVGVSDLRRQSLTQLNALVGQMDDTGLALLIKLGTVLKDEQAKP
jgi:transcriptional regulator with XRE-family HTH domain|tara:strand:+ start:450 stop:797 length:348 start_codon:yes stop_codon:yes gene_type:complete